MIIRDARRDEVPLIVAMLADDALGRSRERLEDPLPQAYFDAFDAIAADANARLVVAEVDGAVVGTAQLTFLPGLSRQGAWRALIEAVRVDGRRRSAGLGSALIRGLVDLARDHGCRMVQLTTDKSRTDAHRFYARLGFHATHEGMKLALD